MFGLTRRQLTPTFVGLLFALSLPLSARADRVDRLLKQLKQPQRAGRS
ncbi:hypothetical protein LCGC14_1682010, partial [marine sediment metagenome]